MASRSGGGGGAIAFAVFLGVLWLVFFVLTLAFYAQINTLKAENETASEQLARFVSPAERDRADRLFDVARQQQTSVFGLLDKRLSETMARATGSPTTTVEQFQSRATALAGQSPLIQRLEEAQREVARLQTELTNARSAQTMAEERLNDQREAVDRLRRELNAQQELLKGRVDDYAERAEDYLKQLTTEQSESRRRVETIRSESDLQQSRLQGRINDLTEQNLVLEGQIQALRAERRTDQLRPRDEHSLVDGTIVAVAGADRTVTIDRGRRHRIVLGMTFAVYTDGAAIRPDASGAYPPGKATIEIINVQENTSTARILRETQGNQIVRGDVIANALYDPDKRYKFVVYGNFDVDADGRFTDREREVVEAWIREWGGEVLPELTGDVDFVVLGSRPVLPPRPPAGSPIEILQEWIRLNRIVERYDELQRRAEATSIPVLNWNRLRTLTGQR